MAPPIACVTEEEEEEEEAAAGGGSLFFGGDPGASSVLPCRLPELRVLSAATQRTVVTAGVSTSGFLLFYIQGI